MKRLIPLGLLISVVLIGALAAMPVFGAGNGDQGLENALAAQEKHTDSLMEIEGVVGTAVGHGAQGNGAVFVFAAARGVKGVPRNLDGVPVITHVTGEFLALHHCKGKHRNDPGCGEDPPTEEPPTEEPPSECARDARCERPVPIGVSTGHPAITAGTIGARVKDAAGNVYALSNNHVYADVNSATIGDNVLQPGAYDGGTDPADAVGTLAAFEPIDFTAGSTNTIDAAIASTTTGDLGKSTLSDGYGTPGSSTKTLRINEKVKKYGRTTGQTKGFVWALNATVDVNYGAPNGVARFVGQIVFKGQGASFSAGGDSGSLIVTQKGGNRPVSLLFAGSSQFTIGNPIDPVLSRFGVTVDGS